MFKGEDVEGWIRVMQRYFLVNVIAEDSRIDVVMPHLEDLALQWFVWTTDQYNFTDWNNFKLQIGKGFSEILTDNVMDQFLNFKQSGSVKEYCDEFEQLSVYLPPIP